jgi:hypothetical protein
VYWNRYRWDRDKAEWYIDLLDSIYMRFNIIVSTISKTMRDDPRIIRVISEKVEEGQLYSGLYLYKDDMPYVQLCKWHWYGPDISGATDCITSKNGRNVALHLPNQSLKGSGHWIPVRTPSDGLPAPFSFMLGLK